MTRFGQAHQLLLRSLFDINNLFTRTYCKQRLFVQSRLLGLLGRLFKICLNLKRYRLNAKYFFWYSLARPIENPFGLKQITKILICSFVWTGFCSPELPKFNNSKPINNNYFT